MRVRNGGEGRNGNGSGNGDQGGGDDQNQHDNGREAADGGGPADPDEALHAENGEGVEDENDELIVEDDNDEPDATGDGEGADRVNGGQGNNRGRTSHAQLRERAQNAERERDEARRQLAERNRISPEEQRRQHAERQAYLASLSPEERAEERQREFEQNTNARLNGIAFALGDSNDRSAYEAQVRGGSKVHRQYQQRVEQLVQTERGNGRDIRRETALKFLIGEDALKRANSPGRTRQRQRAGDAIDRETTRGGGGRGSAAAPSGRRSDQAGAAGARKRLDGVRI